MGKKKTKSRVEEVEDDDDDVAEVAGELDVAADGTAARDGRPKRRAAAERVLLLCTRGVTFRCVSILVCARTHERAYAFERAQAASFERTHHTQVKDENPFYSCVSSESASMLDSDR